MHRIVKAADAKVGSVYYTIRGRRVKVVEVERREGKPFRAVVESEAGDRFLLPPDYPLRELLATTEESEEILRAEIEGSRRKLSSLDPDFIKLVLEGKSNKEIAQILGKDRDVVASRKGNLRAKLKRENKTLEQLATELGVIGDQEVDSDS